jgi:LysR family transcriptional regulator, transcriptional activator of the cysJI operon
MTFKQFMAFMAAAKHRNVTQAAEELHISQPSISKQLKLLQNDYQVTLYHKKDTGGIELTEEGREFLTYVTKIMDDLNALKARFNHKPERRAAKRLAVGGTHALASELLPRLLSEFQRIHLGIDVHLRASSSFAIHNEILRGEIDVGLVAKTPESDRIHVEPYSRHLLVAFVHMDHPLGKKGELSPAELAGAPLVLRGAHRLRSTAEIALTDRGYKLNVVLRGDSPESVRIAVRNKMGIGILFHDAVRNAIERGEFKLLRTPGLTIEAKSFIVYHKERPLSSTANDFLALLKERRPEPTNSQTTPTRRRSTLQPRTPHDPDCC